MDNQSELFISVLSRLIESFASQFNVIVNNFEEKNAQDTEKYSIESLFDTFPRNMGLYQSAVSSLCDLAKCNPSLIIQKLIEIFTNLLLHQDLSVFQILLTANPTFSQVSSQRSLICLNLALFMTTDILSKIVQRIGVSDQGVLISKCAYNLCDKNCKIFIHEDLLNEWSIILAVTSLNNFSDAASLFQSYTDDECNDRIFTLISKLRLDACVEFGSVFLDDICSTLKLLQKKKMLTNHILLCVSSIISSVNFQCDALQKIFDIVWSEKEESSLKDGTFDLIVTLFPHLPGSESKANNFFKHRVYSHAGDDRKVRRSLKLFWKKLIGGYSSLSMDDDLSFVSKKSADAEEHLPVFMDVFFKKSNFAIAPKMFCDVLIHLASIDFTYFLHEMLPNFLLLPISDPRFIVLLSAIRPLNSEGFRKKAISDISKQNIEALNAMVRGKVCQNLCITEIHDKNNCVAQAEDGSFRQIDQSDQKVTHFLGVASLEKLGDLNIQMNAPSSYKEFTPLLPLLESLEFILDDSDFQQQGIISNLVNLCSSSKLEIAVAANKLTNFIAGRESLQLILLKTLLNLLSDLQSQESMYNCISILLNLIGKSPQCLTDNLLHDAEITAFIGLVSTQPITRVLSFRLLNAVDDCLNHKGAFSFIQQNISIMEKCVKQRLLGKNFSNELLLFQWVLSSHFYSIWLLFLTEILDVLIAANYSPLLLRFNDSLSAHLTAIKDPDYKSTPESIGILMLFLASHTNFDIYSCCLQIYRPALFEERKPDLCGNNSSAACSGLIGELLKSNQSWHDQLAFNVIQHLNLSLAGDIADLFARCVQDEIPDASTALLVLINSPASSDQFIEAIRKPCLSFLAVMNTYLLQVGANSVRTVEWTPDRENNLKKSLVVAENYCSLIETIIPKSLSEMDWSVSSRELVLRCLLNWAQTTDPVLEPLRAKTITALAHLARAGPMFNDSLLFDESCSDIFARIEASGNRVLQPLLFYHVDQVLLRYCESCLTSSRIYADLFFDALFVVFTSGSNFNSQQVGCLLLVGLVYQELQHPRAHEFMEAFQSSVYDGFGGATETVFSEALRIIHMKPDHMPVKEIIGALRKFVKEIRLLPKQTVCSIDSPEKFRVYTPFQFLVALMEATEQINDDYFVPMTLLWRDLLNNSDHADIVPLFIMQWKNPASKKKLLISLIKQDAPYIIEKLVSRCSFTYFVHIAEQDKDFDNELWIIEILTIAFERRSGSITNVAALAHFAFLFYEKEETQPLLQALCRLFDVPMPKSSHEDDLMITVIAFVQKLFEDGQETLEEWGTEALKWLFGSEDIRYCSMSLKIYNLIGKPLNDTVLTGIVKVVTYHVENSESDTSVLTSLISESFRFFSNVFAGNEMLAFNFASAFLDCPDFTDNCRAAATDIFLKSLNSQVTNKSAWACLPSILRPLLSGIENDDRSRQILEILIRTSNNEELMMIAAPLKEVYGGFASCKPSVVLVSQANQTMLCKAIEHYALMIETASEQLAEAIFKMAAVSVEKAANENVRDSLSRLYNSALKMLGVCPSAMKFVLAIAEHDPGAATKSTFAFVYWARSIDDVERALNRLVKPSATVTTLSDSSPLASFEAIIGSDYSPKILPFATQQEIIEGMMRVQPTKHRRRGYSIRRADSPGFYKKVDTVATVNWELKPLKSPKTLCGRLQLSTEYGSLVFSDAEFDAAY